MKIEEKPKCLVLHGEDGETVSVQYDNRGDPYRQGVCLTLDDPANDDRHFYCFMRDREAVALRDLLNRLYPNRAEGEQ